MRININIPPLAAHWVHSSNLTWQWKATFFNTSTKIDLFTFFRIYGEFSSQLCSSSHLYLLQGFQGMTFLTRHRSSDLLPLECKNQQRSMSVQQFRWCSYSYQFHFKESMRNGHTWRSLLLEKEHLQTSNFTYFKPLPFHTCHLNMSSRHPVPPANERILVVEGALQKTFKNPRHHNTCPPPKKNGHLPLKRLGWK